MSKLQIVISVVAVSLLIVGATSVLNSAPVNSQSEADSGDWKSSLEKLTADAEQKFNNKPGMVRDAGGWSPPLPPGVAHKQDTVAPQTTPSNRPPGHRGNQLSFLNNQQKCPEGTLELLANLQAPPERLQYFHEVTEHKNLQVDGWQLVVHDITVIDGVTLLKIHSTPLVSMTHGGALVMVGAFEETWQLKDGRLTLLRTAAVGPAPIQGFMG